MSSVERFVSDEQVLLDNRYVSPRTDWIKVARLTIGALWRHAGKLLLLMAWAQESDRALEQARSDSERKRIIALRLQALERLTESGEEE